MSCSVDHGQKKKSRNTRRPKVRQLVCPVHQDQILRGNGKKYFLHLLSAEALQQRGIGVSVYDPHIEADMFPDSVDVIQDLSQAKGHDLAVLVTAHQACIDLDWAALAGQMATPRIYDGRRVLDLDALAEQGWTCHAVGRPFSTTE